MGQLSKSSRIKSSSSAIVRLLLSIHRLGGHIGGSVSIRGIPSMAVFTAPASMVLLLCNLCLHSYLITFQTRTLLLDSVELELNLAIPSRKPSILVFVSFTVEHW